MHNLYGGYIFLMLRIAYLAAIAASFFDRQYCHSGQGVTIISAVR